MSGITTAFDSYKATGSVDWIKTGISVATGAISGGFAASALNPLKQIAISAAVTFTADIATQMACDGESLLTVDYKKARNNAFVAGVASGIGSLYGGILSSGYTSSGKDLISKGTSKFLTAVDKFHSGRSWSKLAKQGVSLFQAGKKMVNTGRGISSVTGTLLTWGFVKKHTT